MKSLEEIPNILKKYSNFLLGIRGLSIKTIEKQNTNLVLFFKFLIKYLKLQINLEDIDAEILLEVKKNHVIAFSTYYSFTLNNSSTTIQDKLSTIRVFYDWLLSITPGGYLYINPTNNILNKEKIDKEAKFLNLDQAKILEEVFTFENSNNPILYNTIISIFLCTGMRVGELINIKIKDVDFNNSTIRIAGKGNKERVAYLSQKCKNRILLYLDKRKNKNKVIEPNDFLFVTEKNKKFTTEEIQKICKKGYSFLGLGNSGYTTHSLRHTAATIMYKYSNKDIYTVKEFLGHDEISTTQRYVHIQEEDLRKLTDNNPLNV